jgi:hypothetical protein
MVISALAKTSHSTACAARRAVTHWDSTAFQHKPVHGFAQRRAGNKNDFVRRSKPKDQPAFKTLSTRV